MTSHYNNGWITTCCSCGYKHVEGIISDDNQPFIEASEKLVIETEDNRINWLTRYICPNCGAIQVDVSDL